MGEKKLKKAGPRRPASQWSGGPRRNPPSGSRWEANITIKQMDKLIDVVDRLLKATGWYASNAVLHALGERYIDEDD